MAPAGAGGRTAGGGAAGGPGAGTQGGVSYFLSKARARKLTRTALARELKRRFTRRAKGMRDPLPPALAVHRRVHA